MSLRSDLHAGITFRCFRIAKYWSIYEHLSRRPRPCQAPRFRIAKHQYPMGNRRSLPPRREVMGGLAKGIDVIRAFGHQAPALSLSEVAKSAKLPPATARRCLLTLEELGYVTRSGRVFLLRPKVLELGAAYLQAMDVEALTKTLLEELAHRTNDSAALSVRDGVDRVYIARASVRAVGT